MGPGLLVLLLQAGCAHQSTPTARPTPVAAQAPYVLQQELLPAKPASTEDFDSAEALAADGNTALIGAAGPPAVAGAAYVYVRHGAAWQQQARLVPTDTSTGDDFGSAVALSAAGTLALVGADLNGSSAGAAYLFARSSSSWQQRAKIVPAGVQQDDGFGSAVALDAAGDTALIGAARHGGAGAAYLYVRVGTTWRQQAVLRSPPSATGSLEGFGSAVALAADGATALVGASSTGGDQAGVAYVFARRGTTWALQATLTPTIAGRDITTNGDSSRIVVALSARGTVALLGTPNQARGNVGDAGAAYVFAQSRTGWRQEAALAQSNGDEGDTFGWAVALSGDGTTALVGDWGKNSSPGANDHIGAAYLYRREGVSWQQLAVLANPKPGIADGTGTGFGENVTLASSGSTLLVGASVMPSGGTYVFVRHASRH